MIFFAHGDWGNGEVYQDVLGGSKIGFTCSPVGWCKSLWHSGLYLVWMAVWSASIIARRGRVKTHPASERSAFRLFREVGIWRSRAGSVGQRAFAPDGRDSTSTLRYMDVAVRRNEGKLCFVKRKSKDLVSNCRRFCEKNISIFEKRERLNKNLWTFLRNASSFLCFLPAFFEKTPVPSLTVSPMVSSSAPPYARTDTPLRIAHSASSKFLPSPFTFTRKLLIQCALCVKEKPFFCLHR